MVEIELHPEIDTKWFIKAKNQMQEVFNKENQMPKHLLLKNTMRLNWSMKPTITMYNHTDYIRCQLQI